MKNKKDKNLSLRVTNHEKTELEKRSKSYGLSLSSYLVKTGLNKPIPKKIEGKELEIYSTLMEFKTNFSRISNLIKSMNQREMLLEISNVVSGLNQELKKIKNG